MEWSVWKTQYWAIIDQLGLSIQADAQSATQLEQYLMMFASERRFAVLQKLLTIFQQPVIIAGAGPSLEQDVEKFLTTRGTRAIRVIAADGATTLLKTKSLLPAAVLTDLDGDHTAIHWALRDGAVILIHAHGDNMRLVASFCKSYGFDFDTKFVWGTTQTQPGNLWNFGGFTDGDRAICMAFHFRTPLIGLMGFDFGNQIGKYSWYNSPIKKSLDRKVEKFQIALSIISSSYPTHKGLRFNLTVGGEEIPGFPRGSFKKFWEEWDRFA